MPKDIEKFSYKCDECDTIFVGIKAYYVWKHKKQNPDRKGYCSKKCSNKGNTYQRLKLKCKTCNESFEKLASRNSKFCSQRCGALYNNAKRNISKREDVTENKIRKAIEQKKKFTKTYTCLTCEKEILNSHGDRKYCNHKCQLEKENKNYISDWKLGKIEGGDKKYGQVSSTVRKYIFNKYNNKCVVCGWCCVNKLSGKIPLHVDHVDGDAYNHKEENLTLLCPNCHSLTPTYGSLNKGNGRVHRREYRIKQDRF